MIKWKGEGNQKNPFADFEKKHHLLILKSIQTVLFLIHIPFYGNIATPKCLFKRVCIVDGSDFGVAVTAVKTFIKNHNGIALIKHHIACLDLSCGFVISRQAFGRGRR